MKIWHLNLIELLFLRRWTMDDGEQGQETDGKQKIDKKKNYKIFKYVLFFIFDSWSIDKNNACVI